MEMFDAAAAINPDMDEETQRWIEAANTETSNSRSASTKSPSPLFISTSPVKKHRFKTPRSSPKQLRPTTSHQAHNTFDASFAAALSVPQTTYDGHLDHNDHDVQTPLVDAYYNSAQLPSTQRSIPRPSHLAPLKPPMKSKPCLSICLWHEICHNSQYTRPAAEILREVLEVRFPVAAVASDGRDHGDALV